MEWILELFGRRGVGTGCTLWPGRTTQTRSCDSNDAAGDDDDTLEDQEGGENPTPIADAFEMMHETALSEEGFRRRNLTSCDLGRLVLRWQVGAI